MTDEKEPTSPRPGSSKEEIALELMRFVATTSGLGKSTGGAGFTGSSNKTVEQQVDALLELYGRCKTAVGA